MSNTKTTLGFISGISVGAIAAILLAPDSGENTRKKIMDTSGDLAAGIKDAVGGIFSDITEQSVSHEDAPAPRATAAGEEKIRRVMHNIKEEIA